MGKHSVTVVVEAVDLIAAVMSVVYPDGEPLQNLVRIEAGNEEP